MCRFDPVAWINTPRWQASRLGLSRMVDLLERLGRPQDELRFVHVAGTNGKGSVCAYVASVLQAAGYKVGLFTSPFILCFEERIRVNGENITGEELARAVAAVRPAAAAVEAACGDHPTEFELMAAVAFEHFRAVGCDIVVLEVGLGGRLDATNVIEAPEASVICRIGLDHTDLLGDTLGAIAGEKAGIVKAGAPVVSWPQESEAMAVIEAVAAERGCELFVPDFADLSVEPLAGAALRRFSWKGRGFETRLLGSYQPFNAALALTAVDVLRGRGWAISDEAAFAGIASARWPGRFEVVDTAPLTIVDGGHNPQGPRPWPPRSPIFWGRRDALRSTLLWACWPTRTTRPWCAPWRRGPAASRCTPRKALAPWRPKSWRAACARLWWKRAGPMTCPCARAALPPMPCAQPAPLPDPRAAPSPSAPSTPSPISWPRCSELAVCENDLMHEKGRPRKSALRKYEKPANRRVP